MDYKKMAEREHFESTHKKIDGGPGSGPKKGGGKISARGLMFKQFGQSWRDALKKYEPEEYKKLVKETGVK